MTTKRQRPLLLSCLFSAVLLAACTNVTPQPEAKLGVQAQPAQVEAEAEFFVDDAQASGGKAALLYEAGQTGPPSSLTKYPAGHLQGKHCQSESGRVSRAGPVMRVYTA